jgi:hypothetical protein
VFSELFSIKRSHLFKSGANWNPAVVITMHATGICLANLKHQSIKLATELPQVHAATRVFRETGCG